MAARTDSLEFNSTWRPTLEYRCDVFALRKLDPSLCWADYQTVMANSGYLQDRFAEWPQWPLDGFTMEENFEDLEKHDKEWLNGEAFAYSILTPTLRTVIGSVYVNPPRDDDDGEAYIRYWLSDEVREDEEKTLLALKGAIENIFGITSYTLTNRSAY
jgi:RimJ/RimL family protein N-acetyltransferase